MPEREKQTFIDQAQADRARFFSEVEDWKKSLKKDNDVGPSDSLCKEEEASF